jgi:SAM-dependent methyltransferase
MRLVEVDCSLCGSAERVLDFILNDHSIVRCVECGFKYVSPRPEEALILRAYSQESIHDELSFAHEYADNKDVDGNYSWTGAYVLRRLAKRVPGGSFLDIGAGQGWAVSESLKNGMDAWGYEFGDKRAFDSDERLRGRIFHSWDDLVGAGKKFDIIFSSAVLEHVYDPKAFLDQWRPFLNQGGLFCVAAVPNVDSIFIRLKLDGWDGNIPFHHLNYFSPSSLADLVRRANFEMVDMFTMGAPISASVRNVFIQDRFKAPYWGDNAIHWRLAGKTHKVLARSKKDPVLTLVTAISNHLIRMTGMGANIYATFRCANK